MDSKNNIQFKVDGMTCSACEIRIEQKVGSLPGVKTVTAKYTDGSVEVLCDDSVSQKALRNAIESLKYTVKEKGDEGFDHSLPKKTSSYLLGLGFIALALLLIFGTSGLNVIPEVDGSMGYGILFVVGLITSLHCVAMCGGITLSQCVPVKRKPAGKWSTIKPSVLYNLGRVISYTLVGGIVGTIGSAVSLTGPVKGIVAIIAGVFMVIMGLNMLNLSPFLRRLVPRMPKFFGKKIGASVVGKTPFYVGLLNSLMPCGPLQSMQLYALGTGSFLGGALSMLVFSLGTVPLMFSFGAVSSFLSGKLTSKMMKASAVLVMILGVVMLGRGFSLSGLQFPAAQSAVSGSIATVNGDVQVVKTSFSSGSYVPIVVQKGIPVQWTISISDRSLNGCNNPVTIPKYNLSVKLVPGENLIQFIPAEEGTIVYTCWMGMIKSTIHVVDTIVDDVK